VRTRVPNRPGERMVAPMSMTQEQRIESIVEILNDLTENETIFVLEFLKRIFGNS
jgi:hypothetical protein